MKRLRSVLLPAWVTLVLIGCGGGGGQLADGGSSGTGVSSGPLTAAATDESRITLNERTLDTSSAEIEVNGLPGSLSDLRPGHVVRVEADFDSNRATRITFDPQIVGRVDTVSMSGGIGTLGVLGQTVIIDGSTIAGPGIDPSMIAPGDPVRVSGLAAGDGSVTATRIESVDPAQEPRARVRGVMHNPGIISNDSMRIGALSIDHSNAVLAGTSAGPMVGDHIAATGHRSDAGVLDADEIRKVHPIAGEAGDFLELAGILQGRAATGDFSIHNLVLDLSVASVAGGPLAAGDRVRVAGRIDDQDHLRVTEISVLP